jgi:hypothetical protein
LRGPPLTLLANPEAHLAPGWLEPPLLACPQQGMFSITAQTLYEGSTAHLIH